MRILTVSDKVEPVLYGPYIRERVGNVDLILACGDLPFYYLEYIVSLLDAPLYFVHGNHDRAVPQPSPEWPFISPGALSWATNLHGRNLCHQSLREARHCGASCKDGLLLAGLEGCRTYNPGAPFQYTEAEARRQVFALGWKLYMNRLRYGRYLDILITHAPPRGIHDDQDLPHQGFASYLKLLRRYRPALMIHGHRHVYDRNDVTETDYEGTRIINTFGYRVIELAPSRTGRGWQLVTMGQRRSS